MGRAPTITERLLAAQERGKIRPPKPAPAPVAQPAKPKAREARPKQVGMFVSEVEHAALKALAAQRGLSLDGFVRRAVVAMCRADGWELPATLRD